MDISARLGTRSGALAISAGALLWGTTGVVVHAVHSGARLPVAAIGFYRLAVGAAALLTVRSRGIVRLFRDATRRQRALLALAGAGLGIYQALYFVGVAQAGVSIATLVSLGTAPVVVTVAGALRRRRLPRITVVVPLVAALSGLAMLSWSGTPASAAHPLLGLLASLGSGLAYGVSTLLNRHLAVGADALTLTGLTSLVGAATLLPVALLGSVAVPLSGWSLPALLYLGVVTTAVGYGLFFGGLRSTPAEIAAVLTLLEGVAATVLAVALLGEPVTVVSATGTAVLLLAISYLYLRPTAST